MSRAANFSRPNWDEDLMDFINFVDKSLLPFSAPMRINQTLINFASTVIDQRTKDFFERNSLRWLTLSLGRSRDERIFANKVECNWIRTLLVLNCFSIIYCNESRSQTVGGNSESRKSSSLEIPRNFCHRKTSFSGAVSITEITEDFGWESRARN